MNGVNFHKMIMMLIMATMMILTSVTMLIGWMVGASTKAGKAGSVQAIKVSLGRDSPVVTWDIYQHRTVKTEEEDFKSVFLDLSFVFD